jgi:uncharacterized protein YkwD
MEWPSGGRAAEAGRAGRARATRILGTFAWVALAGCTGVPIPLPVPTQRAPAPLEVPAPTELAIEHEVHARINAHRNGRGLRALAYDEQLAGIARSHSAAMASGGRAFGHAGLEERSSAAGAVYSLRSFAENVAVNSGPDVAARAAEGWMGSAGHRRNIEGDFEVTGVGVVRGTDGRFYLTQVFLAQRSSSSARGRLAHLEPTTVATPGTGSR